MLKSSASPPSERSAVRRQHEELSLWRFSSVVPARRFAGRALPSWRLPHRHRQSMQWPTAFCPARCSPPAGSIKAGKISRRAARSDRGSGCFAASDCARGKNNAHEETSGMPARFRCGSGQPAIILSPARMGGNGLGVRHPNSTERVCVAGGR